MGACGAPPSPASVTGASSPPFAEAVTEPVAAFAGPLSAPPEPGAPAPGAAPAEPETSPPVAAGAEEAVWTPKLPVVAREQTRAIVLMYHSFSVVPGRLRGVLPSELEKQIRHLRENGIEIIPLSRLVEWYDGRRALPRKVAVLTMDDAEKAQYTLAWPVLQREKAPFAVAIPTFGMELPWSHAGRFDWAELEVMTGSGLCELASHGHTHSNLTGMAPGQLENEVVRSKKILEARAPGGGRGHSAHGRGEEGGGGARTAPPIDVFVHPFGAYDWAVMRSLERAGYRVALGTVGEVVTHKSPRWGLGRWEVNGQTTFDRFRGYVKSAKMVD